MSSLISSTGKKILAACFVLTIVIGLIFAAVIANKEADEFWSKVEYSKDLGLIRGYVKPVENDDMYTYIVLCDIQMATQLTLYAIPKDVYDSFDDTLKHIIDNEETGWFLEFTKAYNQLDFDTMGYSYIKSVERYDNTHEEASFIQDRSYEW